MVTGVHFATEITAYFFLLAPSPTSVAGRSALLKIGLFSNLLKAEFI
jgi:hypothetical protein